MKQVLHYSAERGKVLHLHRMERLEKNKKDRDLWMMCFSKKLEKDMTDSVLFMIVSVNITIQPASGTP